MPENKTTKTKKVWKTIKSLRLDLQAARDGRTWELLPPGFRDQESGKTYPLPTRTIELQELSTVFIPPRKLDCGCFYLHRAIKEWKRRMVAKGSALQDVTRQQKRLNRKSEDFVKATNKELEKVREASEKAQAVAAKACASLADLFDLGREGLEKQMRAYLDNEKVNNHPISNSAFRDCFRMVTQAVKGLGIPSDQKPAAEAAIEKEFAEGIKRTRAAQGLAPGSDKETTH